MDVKKQRVLVTAPIAGLLAAVGSASRLTQTVQAADEVGKKVPCYGINKCKGSGDCGGKGHSCAGQNACKGQGYISLSEKDCLRIEGGRLTADGKS